jgi:hypothetical protein
MISEYVTNWCQTNMFNKRRVNACEEMGERKIRGLRDKRKGNQAR